MKKEYDWVASGVAGAAVEKVTHFSTDEIAYHLVLRVPTGVLSVKIDKGNFKSLHSYGLPAYRNDTPWEGTNFTRLTKEQVANI